MKSIAAKSVQHRLLVPLAGVLLLMAGIFCTVLFDMQRRNLEQSNQQIMEYAASKLSDYLACESAALAVLGEAILYNKDLCEALKNCDQAQLLTSCAPLFALLREKHGITHFYFHQPDCINLLRLHKPDQRGDLIDRFTMLEAERTGKIATGIELGPLGTFTLRMVQPVFVDNILVGYLELGREIEDALAEIHADKDIELAVTINKAELDQTQWQAGMKMLGREANWDRYADNVLIYSSVPKLPCECRRFLGRACHEHDGTADDAECNGASWRVMTAQLKDVSGTVVGHLVLGRNVSQTNAALGRFLIVIAIAAAALLVVLLGFLYVMARRTDMSIRAHEVELAESEKRLRESEETLRAVLDAVPDLMLVLDADGRYRDIFTSDPALLLAPASSLLGKTIHEVMSTEDAGRIQNTINKALATGELQQLEYTFDVDQDNMWFAARVTKFMFQNSECVLWSARDITLRKRAEAKLESTHEQLLHSEKLGAVGKLAASITHELNNPIYGIRNVLERLRDKAELDTLNAELVDVSLRECNRVRDLVLKLRDFNHPTSGVKSVFSVHHAIDDVLLLCREKLVSRRIEVIRNYADNLPDICAVSDQIKQVILNIVTNAEESIPERTRGRLSITTDGDAENIRVHIGSNGIPVRQQDIPHLFEPFFTTKREVKGTGLGLSVSYGIVKKHGGTIEITNEDGVVSGR